MGPNTPLLPRYTDIHLTGMHLKRKYQKIIAGPLIFVMAALTFASAPQIAYAHTCGFGTDNGAGSCVGYLTTADVSPWTVPNDWSNTNQIELIGSGGSGAGGTKNGASGGAGGGGAYVKNTDVSLSIGAPITFFVGSGNTASPASTTFNGSAMIAAPGQNGGVSGVGAAGGAGEEVEVEVVPEAVLDLAPMGQA